MRLRPVQESAGPTKAVFQYDEPLRTLVTSALSVEPISHLDDSHRALFKQLEEEDLVIQTKETIFYAQSGGQPFDTGYMKKTADDATSDCVFQVKAVRNAGGGKILHLGRFEDGKGQIQNGDVVTQVIDGDKRYLHSRLHTAGHILGMAVRHIAQINQGVTELKAQHYPDSAFVEFQGLIDGKHKDAIQQEVDQIVKARYPVHVHWWDRDTARQRCAFFPEVAGISHNNTVRVMEIESVGAYPCGGTHVSDTGAVGKVQVRRITRQKGITKISYSVA